MGYVETIKSTTQGVRNSGACEGIESRDFNQKNIIEDFPALVHILDDTEKYKAEIKMTVVGFPT